jgi:hypothetical protein
MTRNSTYQSVVFIFYYTAVICLINCDSLKNMSFDQATICTSRKNVTRFSTQLNCSMLLAHPSTFEASLPLCSFALEAPPTQPSSLLGLLLPSCSALTDISSPFHDQITVSHTPVRVRGK